jgi:hypothetical protein
MCEKSCTITGYWLLVTGFWLLVTRYWLLVTRYWLLVTGCSLLVTRYWLLVSGNWLFVAGFGCMNYQLSDAMSFQLSVLHEYGGSSTLSCTGYLLINQTNETHPTTGLDF